MSTPRVYGGFSVLTGGMNGGFAPSLLPANQCALAVNMTFRDGYVKTRPPYASRFLEFTDDITEGHWAGKFQGAVSYQADDGANDGHVVSRGGRLFFAKIGDDTATISEITPQNTIVTTADFTVPAPSGNVTVNVTSEGPFTAGQTVFIDSGEYTITTRGADQLFLVYVGSAANPTVVAGTPVLDSSLNIVKEYQLNDANAELIFMFQAENYVIVCGGQRKTIIFDGSSARPATFNEIPPCALGVYVWGRIWIARPNRMAYAGGDIVYGPSGTSALGERDAVLKFTENDFLNEGGDFGVPSNSGPITSMIGLATQDTSLGVGNLLIGTTNAVFSNNTPVDRTIWKNLTSPLQTVSLIDYGPTGPRSSISVNGDMWYRSADGFRSFIVARREISSWGNTPMSREVTTIIDYDDPSLLFYGSSIFFDNRFIATAAPNRTSLGICHNGLVDINFDMLSSLAGKSAPAWEGAGSGLTVFQILKGRIGKPERAFSWVNNDGEVELWEFLKTGYYDEFNTIIDDLPAVVRTPIQCQLESRADNHGSSSQLKKLETAELYLDQLVDDVTLVVRFRPDQHPAWVDWATISLCANVSQCKVNGTGAFACQILKTGRTSYAARIMLPQPSETCVSISGRPASWAYEYQYRIEGAGHYRIRAFKAHAMPQTDKTGGDCPPAASCKTIDVCDIPIYSYNSHGT